MSTEPAASWVPPASGTPSRRTPSIGRGIGLPARRSVRCIHGLEGQVVEPDGPSENGAVMVDHGDGLTRRERLADTRWSEADFVEVDDPEAGQWVDGLVEVPASDARVDGDGRGEPGVDVEVYRLPSGLVGQKVV